MPQAMPDLKASRYADNETLRISLAVCFRASRTYATLNVFGHCGWQMTAQSSDGVVHVSLDLTTG